MIKKILLCVILCIILFVVTLICFDIIYSSDEIILNENENSTETILEGQILNIDAETILNDYNSDELKADLKYKNKTYNITGRVAAVSEVLGQKYILLDIMYDNYSINRVQCFFNNKSDDLVLLSKDDIVKIRGIVSGYDVNVQVENCEIIN